MSVPDILKAALWLQSHHNMFLSVADHPGRPECGGSHRECDGQRGKHPRGQWSRLATNNGAVIRALLDGGPWNLLVACKQSGLLGVDEDRPGAFGDFAASVGEVVPLTFTVSTSKGRHYYFRQVDGAPLGNGRGRLAGYGIDIRGGGAGSGGFLIGPGSVHESGVIYSPLDAAAPILPVPGWLAEALRPVRGASPTRQHASVPLRPGSRAERLLCGLVGKVLHARPPAPGVPGERNELLFWAACRGFEHVMSGLLTEADVRSTLLEAAVQNGLGHAGALATIDSARRNVFEGGAA